MFAHPMIDKKLNEMMMNTGVTLKICYAMYRSLFVLLLMSN